jgi:hypothetical protein
MARAVQEIDARPDAACDRFRGWMTEEEARLFLEKVRWPNGPIRPHCGSLNNAAHISNRPDLMVLGPHLTHEVLEGTDMEVDVVIGVLNRDSPLPLWSDGYNHAAVHVS